MKILFIADILPDTSSGSAVRNYHLLKTLTKKHEVDFIGLTDNKRTANMKVYKDFNIKNYVILERSKLSLHQKCYFLLFMKIPYIQMRRKMLLPNEYRQKLSNYDVIHLAELNSYFFIEKYLSNIHKPVVLDAHNVEYIRFSDEIKNKPVLTKNIGKLLANKLKYYEIQAVKQIEQLFVCSSVDRKYFEKYISERNISVIPNGVTLSDIKLKDKTVNSQKITILFMGLLSYFPNDEGLFYYLSQIHPKIKKLLRDYELVILGKEAQKWLIEKTKNDTNITLKGYVDDIKPYIVNATMCIAPLLSGSGTRLKILEYMGMKKPVVATPKAAEGINVTHKKNILLAKNEEEFINDILLLSRDTQLQQTLGNNARRVIEEQYSWEEIGKELLRVYKTL